MPENVAERYRRVTIWSMSAMYGNTAHHGSGSVPTSIHAANSQAVPSQPMKLIAYSRFGPILVIAQPNTGISGSETAASRHQRRERRRMVPVVHHEEHEHLAEHVHRHLHQKIDGQMLAELLDAQRARILAQHQPCTPQPAHHADVPVTLLAPRVRAESGSLRRHLPGTPPAGEHVYAERHPRNPQEHPQQDHRRYHHQQQTAYGHLPQLGARNADRGDRRRDHRGDQRVVESDHRHITGHVHAVGGEPQHDAHRDQIVVGDDGGGVHAPPQCERGLIAALDCGVHRAYLIDLESHAVPDVMHRGPPRLIGP